MREIWRKLQYIVDDIAKHHVSAYASQSAFFTMFSLFPIMMLLMTAVRFTPATQGDVIQLVYDVFPKAVSGTMISIVDEVYKQTGTAISLSIFVTMWAAGKGVMAISNGLNTIQGIEETRSYVYMRVRSTVYTVFLVVAIVLNLVLLGFGNSISLLVNKYIPMFQYVIEFLIEIRMITMICVIIVVAIVLYQFLPNKRGKLKHHIPGAIFTAFGWTFASFVFSVYMDVFPGFSNMYGSLTTIVLIMLWLYVCMYILLLGGEMNVLIMRHLDIEN